MPSAVPSCDLKHYRELVGSLPLPSEEQIADFVNFVCHAHSWYKHLPLLPPGIPFCFFLDPCSGCDCLRAPDGRIVWKERTENSLRFHYTWMTTADYRRRFGHLNYAAQAGTAFVVPSEGGVREFVPRPMFGCAEGTFRIPEEIDRAGSVSLTGVVHIRANQPWVWVDLAEREKGRFWPAETGGSATLKKILETSGNSRELDFENKEKISAQLTVLLEPERLRLQKQMRAAIRAMLQTVQGSSDLE